MGGVVSDGVVLDVRNLGHSGARRVHEQRVAVEALRKLTGAELGDDPAAWRRWLRQRR